ncbi:MAG: 16S rRNA (cytidine(1402)-2'-O)-methyltransferase [Actinobacteria bacterium]|nr:16S rRNA (cytidine(1402)-2'-O)-methyltransferase [Actinomycetota bacterium]
MSGRLVLAASPIGDFRDASARLISELASADVIAAGDTRRFKRLCSDVGIVPTGRVISYFEANEVERTPGLVADLKAGLTVVVITDAGMPSVSDPGFRLVSAAVDAGIAVTALPGPSAVLMALAVSGLPSDRFCFEGFLPRKAGERTKSLQALEPETRTMIFFEAPHRLSASLSAMKEVLGSDRPAAVCRELTKTYEGLSTSLSAMKDVLGSNRPAAVCRELTKTYEEIRRGTLAELGQWAADGVKGEITIVVQGASRDTAVGDPAQWVAQVQALESAGMTRKEAIADVAHSTGARKRDVFDAVVDAKRQQ